MADDQLPSQIRDTLEDALARAHAENATPEDGRRFRELLRKHPGVLGFKVDMASAVVDRALRDVKASEANRALLRDKIERLRAELAGDEHSTIERLLIDQVAICYLRLNLTEQNYAGISAAGCPLPVAVYWERKLSAVQRRYLRAIETLARVRKLMGVSLVQINIAAAGGQQVVSN